MTLTQGVPNMRITIKPLSRELIPDYFDFFNNRAFTDNPPWGGCYCTGFQMTKAEEKAQFHDRVEELGGGQDNFMRALQEIVVRQIEGNALRGYLAYVDNVSIGWCNANDKASLPAEAANGFKVYAPSGEREKVVLCFEIAPGYRGKGVATALLERVIEDARAEGYSAVEGYPQIHSERTEWDYTGPIRLYEKAGFTRYAQLEDGVVMRKQL